MLRWISEQAKWIIYIFITFIVIGLLFMGNGRTGQSNDVAEVDGAGISLTEYSRRLDNREQQFAGQNLSDADRVRLRKDVLKELIQSREIQKEIAENDAVASSKEMFEDLRTQPPAQWKQAEIFQTNGQFDQAKFEAWLSTDSIYDMKEIRQYENYLRLDKIPMQQLQLLVGAGYHPTTLEARLNVLRRDTRFKLNLVRAVLDSFHVSEDFATDEKVSAWYEAHPDSFVATKDMATYKAVVLKQTPAGIDEENALKMAAFLYEQAKEGADFAQLAQENSEDPGSKEQGGMLGGFQEKEVFVPEFSEAAWALDSGEISKPVKTQFGYHVIKSMGKKQEGGKELANLAHILIRVQAGTETLDSLRSLLEGLRLDVMSGKSLEKAAEEAGLKVEDISQVPKGEALGKYGFFAGLESYTYKAQSEEYSEVLQNDQYFALVQKTATASAGTRDLEKNKDLIKGIVKREEQKRLAREYLLSKEAQVKSASDLKTFANSDEKLVYDSTSWVSLDSYVPGLGFNNPDVGKLFDLSAGNWSPVIAAERGVALVKVIEKTTPDAAQVETMVASEMARNQQYLTQTLFNEWLKLLPRRVEVKSNLYNYYAQ